MKCKCGREARKEENLDTNCGFLVCSGCGIWVGNCRCRHLDVPSLASFTKEKEGD